MRRIAISLLVFAAVLAAPAPYAHGAARPDPATMRNNNLVEAFKPLNKKMLLSVLELRRRWSQKRIGLAAVVSSDGLIMTALTLVKRKDEFLVTNGGGKIFVAKVVARDRRNGLALLKIKKPPENLIPVKAGNGEKLDVGSFVMTASTRVKPAAVGVKSSPIRRIAKSKRAPFLGLFSVLTDENKGPQRHHPCVIQHDSPVTSKNLGGPLFDREGNCVGINVAAAWRGVSYAVPFEVVEESFKILRNGDDIDANGYIGVRIADAGPELLEGTGLLGGGVLVSDAVKGFPAEKAGMKEGDIITHINGERVGSSEDLQAFVMYLTPGAKAVFRVMRIKGGKLEEGEKDEELKDIEVVITERPEE